MKTRCLFLLGSAILAGIFCAPAALAQENCSNNVVNGSYGVTGNGTSTGVGPVAFVAIFDFDGNGNLSGSFYQKVNGNNVQPTFTGTYTVEANCVVSVTNYLSNGITATLILVFVDGGKEFYLVNTTAPTATTGITLNAIGKRRRKD